MDEEKCVCGHTKSEHEVVSGATTAVCLHEEASGEIECDCMEFMPAESESVAGKS
jgi:hypothetical protein